MKSSLLALLLVAVVLFVAVESHRRFRGLGRRPPRRWNNGKPMGQWNGNRRRWHGGNQGGHFRPLGWNHGKPMGPYNGNRWKWQRRNQGRPCDRLSERPRNCSDFLDGTCVACDDQFVLKTFNFPRCNKTICVPCWRLKWRNPDLYRQQCERNTTARFKCPRGCVNCSSHGVCTECKPGLKLYSPPNSNITKCVSSEAKQNKSACGKMCMECSESGVCLKCIEPLELIQIPVVKGLSDPEYKRTICGKPGFYKGKTRKGGRNPGVLDVPQ
ncbi:uncharacterized protein [Porites lutea]|uniref:uncharacterized protein isoform X1 n=1 Tax=Porites lutea TaxID=51062 RepID=UPI003CC5E809